MIRIYKYYKQKPDYVWERFYQNMNLYEFILPPVL